MKCLSDVVKLIKMSFKLPDAPSSNFSQERSVSFVAQGCCTAWIVNLWVKGAC